MSLLGERVHCGWCDMGTEGVYLIITFICLESNVKVMCHQNWVQGLLLSKERFSKFTFTCMPCYLLHAHNSGLFSGQMLN